MSKYIRIMRLDHWIKQFFILPGFFFAILLISPAINSEIMSRLILAFFSVSLIASANYVINEWLDAEFDKFHPTKKNRSVVTEDVKGNVVWTLWVILTCAGFFIGWQINFYFLLLLVWLWIMGIVYNVKPLRTKDIFILDVLSESVNNMIRLLLGWFIVFNAAENPLLPPISMVIGYWMLGAFLMAIKRYAEYRMIGDPILAGKYRKSFKSYSEKSLLTSAFFYAMCSIFFTGIFLIKYRIELVLLVPFLIGLFCYYFWLSYEKDSAVQKPEKLYREKYLMTYCFLVAVMFAVLVFVDIPQLKFLTEIELVPL